MRIFLSGAVFLGVACAGAEQGFGWEPPKVYYSLFSLYETAEDYRDVLDLGAAVEVPVLNGPASVARFRYRKDLVGAVDERTVSLQAASRRHPWEWLPGFFAEVLVGYANVRGVNLHRELPAEGSLAARLASAGRANTSLPPPSPSMKSFHKQTLEAGVGFGYAWNIDRMLVSIGLLLGPEYQYSDATRADGARTSSQDWGDASLLRFNHLEIGYSF